MATLYFISLLDPLALLFVTSLILGLLALVCYIILYMNKVTTSKKLEFCKEYQRYTEEYEVDIYSCEKGMKIAKYFIIAGLISLFGLIFVPSTKQALLIYGVGGTMDYLKENKTAKELPDKFIVALDNYLDGLIDKDEKVEDNENR